MSPIRWKKPVGWERLRENISPIEERQFVFSNASLMKGVKRYACKRRCFSGGKGGRVVSVSPGIITTPTAQKELGGPSREMMLNMIDSSATGRIGTPDDIVAAVEFLVSPASSFITGTDLLVDGGTVAAWRYGDAPSGQ